METRSYPAPAPAPASGAATPATAAWISSGVASGTSKLRVKMQPLASLASSQVFPRAVGSPIWPGANVPAFNASRGSPPTLAICLASSNVIALLTAAALGDAGSCDCVTVVSKSAQPRTQQLFYLMLRNGSNLGVYGCNGRARCGDGSNRSGVSLECSEDQCVDLALDITSCFGVSESLVSSSLLQASRVLGVGVRDIPT